MLKSFFKIAVRCLWRRKTYTLLNFVCLTFGLTCSIIATMYVLNILGHDRFHKNYDRLYQVDAYVTYFNGARFPKEYLSASLTDALKEHAPEIEDLTRLSSRDYSFMSGEKVFAGSGFFADSNFFEVFTFPLLRYGNHNVLSDPNSIVISEKMSGKFFGSTDCVGKTLTLKDGSRQETFTIAGVFKEIPAQSVLQFEFVIPFSKFLSDNRWALESGATANETWALLKRNVSKSAVEDKIKNLISKQETTLNQELFLFPLKEHILYSYAGGKRVWKEMQNLVIIGSIGFAILLIACFNFINLAIALNFKRYREAGVRKVAGSDNSGIVFQFLVETFVLVLACLFTAIILIKILLPVFNSLSNSGIQINMIDLRMIIFFILIALFTGLISGLLPALYLASSNPINSLKGKILKSHSFSRLRQSLIIFQFVIPVTLIVIMIVIRAQDRYMRNYDVGVDKDKLIILNNSGGIQRHSGSFKSDLLSIPGVEAVSYTNCIPSRGAKVSNEVQWEGKDATEKLHFWCINSDFDYNKIVNLNIYDGRFFNQSYSTDSTSYLINNVAADVMKMKNPLGASITVDGIKGSIIGVFRDFHAIDLAGPFVPSIIRINANERPHVLVKYTSGSFGSVSVAIRSVYDHYEKEDPFRAILFRDLISFSNLSLPSKLVGLAFIIALLLACMGLFGLASFTSENRTKEIGVRKANGATTSSVIRLLLKNYIRWLIASILIALPIAFLLARFFLGRFYFHPPMPVIAYIAGPLIAVVVALLTVIMLTWKVAGRNPVKSLRYE